MTSPRVVVLGTPGSGPTSTGSALAELLGVAHHDTERLAAADLGHDSVARAFVVAGEPAFHAAEVAVALRLLADPATAADVVVLGSGVLASPEVREAVAADDVVAVQLTVTLAHAAPRLGLAIARPVFLGNPRAQWSRLAAEQAAAFDAVSTHVVDTDDRTPAEVAAQLHLLLAPAEPLGEDRP